MKISFEAYETTRGTLPLAPINLAPKPLRRATLNRAPRRDDALFHAWRP